ncbi:DinB family protein [Nocardioides sp. KIGAM211]|uniref:DinB family protein n=1 Tax=Nocardioides luti TaxID=2761101 RepID=A0A7X0RLF7_9ACTN|nr:DinB family protein [Nocardioides luti]MBB6629239.1 DinB family protein [Nocardioides luti]
MTTNPTATPGWNELLLDQLTFHWEHALRPRLEGLTDDEYLWEPADGAWSIRPRGTSTSPAPIGVGAFERDDAPDDPDPAPVTTIAWRLAHITVEVLAMRSASHFGREATDYESWAYAGTAAEALAQLDREVDTWRAGVLALGEDGLARPCGPAEGPFGDLPMAALVLHIHREVIHHGAEICLLRDLYAHRFPSTPTTDPKDA